MKDIILIDTTWIHYLQTFKYSLENINGKNSLQILLEKLSKLNIDKLLLLPPKNELDDSIKAAIEIAKNFNIATEFSKIVVRNKKEQLETLSIFLSNNNYENIILLYSDSPFIDIDELLKLYNLHKEGKAEYTFGDNYAEGLVPEILSRNFIEKVKEKNYKKPDILSRKVFDCIEDDINKYFIEVQVAEKDFSIKRFELTASSKRNIEIIKNLKKFVDFNCSYIDLFNAIEEHPEILHIFPRYVEIEITNNCNLNCSFCPRIKMNRKVEDMHFSLFKKIIDQLASAYDDIIVSFTLMGEPTMHPFFVEFVDYAINSKIFNIIIETNGTLFNNELIKNLSSYPIDKLTILFGIDAINSATYNKLRASYDGKNYFETVCNNIKNFLEYRSENRLRTFIQIIKMEDNKKELEDFYKFWEKFTGNIVIQKYNNYLNLLPDREIADFTPLDRVPCWHLQRDIEIFSNGSVPLCKQDINCSKLIGNLNNETIIEIWEKLKKYYIENAKFNFNDIKECSICDEWWTFNF